MPRNPRARNRLNTWVLLAIGIWVVHADAQTPTPRFVGTVSLTNVQKTVAIVNATLNVTIQDQTGAAIANPAASVSLTNMSLRREWRLIPISPAAISVATFQIPLKMTLIEYARWELGVAPVATLQFVDAAGKSAHTTVVLNIVRLPGGVAK
jgi:hypothetical protein